ncbi:MAG: methionyl-tRNA formyltransferase [Candidatus Daviesbacteria bacterium]|nr:methionyl-tRNA formyltransferase [Candidatus Daviesbacteria bacterium]
MNSLKIKNLKFKIIFLGTPDFVQPIRQELTKHFTLVDSLNEADLGVVAAYGKILTKDELNTPKYGCINVHPSLLPKYRGPSPIQEAILKGDRISGITVIKMDEEVDHGPIIYQEEMELSDMDNFDTLSKKMFHRAAEVLSKIIEDFIAGKIEPHEQNHAKASSCQRLTRKSGYFDISNPPPPEILDRMIRAYHPWPGVWTKWNGKIVKLHPKGVIQMEGKKVIPLPDFLNGYPDFPLKKL